jgi:hypothetical protein
LSEPGSLPIVSVKWEYSRNRLETFCDLGLGFDEATVQRHEPLPKKPVFPAHSGVSLGSGRNAGMVGWRRSADRTRLHANSLLSGNFTGNFATLRLPRSISQQETAVLQRLIERFPTQINREKIQENREFLSGNREIFCQTQSSLVPYNETANYSSNRVSL